MKSKIALMAALAASLFGTYEYEKLNTDFRTQRKRRKKGSGRGGFRPPRHARAKAFKKTFGGLAVPRIDRTQFMFA